MASSARLAARLPLLHVGRRLPPRGPRPLRPRHYSSSSSPSSAFQHHPSPPRLPADEQAEFERLQRAAAFPLASPAPATTTAAATAAPSVLAASTQQQASPDSADGDGVWRGAPPEFEGDKNPKTGEIGGPKNEPLRWGSQGEWTYNGRATDF